MIKEGIPANSLNIRALVNKNPEVLANEMSMWLREAGQQTGVIIHDISFVQTPEGTCACWYLEAPFIEFFISHDLPPKKLVHL